MLTISRAKKFIFLHIPKTGGTSIAHALADYSDVPLPEYYVHSHIGVCRSLLTEDEVRSFYKFCVVRNPWDWMVSLYFDYLARPEIDMNIYNFAKENGFSGFIDYAADTMRISQSDWLFDCGDMFFDKVIRYENIENEFREVCDRLDISCHLPKLNVTKERPSHKSMYDKYINEKFKRKFSKDIEILKYDFNPITEKEFHIISPKIIKYTEECIKKSEQKISCLTEEGTDEEFIFSLCNLYIQQGNHHLAEENYRRLMEIDPSSARYLFGLSFALDRQDRVDEALSAVLEAVERDPLLHEAHNHLSHLYSRLGRFADAEAACRRAIEIAPNHGGYRYTLSFALDRQDRVDEALSAALEAVERDPLLHEAHSHLSHLYSRLGRFADAEAACRRAIEIAPNHGGYRYTLSFALDRQDRVDEALSAALEAVERDPLLHEAHSHLSHLYSRLGRFADAEAACRRAIEIAPNHGGYRYTLSFALDRQDRVDEALSAALEAVERNPLLHEAHSHLSHLYSRLGRFADAEAACRRAIEIAPNHGGYRYTLSFALDRQDRVDEALSAALEAVERDPLLHEAHSHLSHLYSRLGRFADAEAARRPEIEITSNRDDYSKS